MKKRVMACLMALLLLGSAQAEVRGKEWMGETYCDFISNDGVQMKLDWDAWCYTTGNGLCFQAGGIAMDMYREELIPQSEAEVQQVNDLLAALGDASAFWDEQVTGEEIRPVYTMRDEDSVRTANGQAKVALSAGARLLMTWDDWSLIEYEVSSKQNRIGWVQGKMEGSAPVMLADVAVRMLPGGFLTDDPGRSATPIATVEELTDVHLLASYGELWGYVSAKTTAGQSIGGFVPLRLLARDDVVDEETVKSLAGTWGFVGGGELLPTIFTLMEDGTIVTYTMSEEAMETQAYLTQGILPEMQLETIWRGAWQIVTGTAYAERDLVVTYENGRVSRYHVDGSEENVLSLTQGEAGGSWTRLNQ